MAKEWRGYPFMRVWFNKKGHTMHALLGLQPDFIGPHVRVFNAALRRERIRAFSTNEKAQQFYDSLPGEDWEEVTYWQKVKKGD